MSYYAETAPLPRRRAMSYCNRPLPPLPSQTTPTSTPTNATSANGGKPMKRRRTMPSQLRLSHFPTPPPTLYPQEQVNALSLQDQTFLYILSHIDCYPPELLGLLPKMWRKRLLAALPPFRLYQLERTPIAQDIDTDELWEKLSRLQDCVWGGYMTDRKERTLSRQPTYYVGQGRSKPVSLRSRFINYLSHLLFNEMNRDYACKRITKLLHATHVDMLDSTVANSLIFGHVNSLFMFQPPYYLIPFRCPNLTERELYWSLHGNQMLPIALELYVNNLDSSPLWNQEIISQEMMRRILSKIEFLKVYNHAFKTNQLDEIINAVTHSSKYREPPSLMGNLKHLEILRADDTHLATVSRYFSAPNGYLHLTKLTVSMRPLRYIQATGHLVSMIRHQLNSLEELELSGFTCYITRNIINMGDYMLFMQLSQLVMKQQFRSLTLTDFKDIPWILLRMILEANLRTVPSHDQTITLRNISVSTASELPFVDDCYLDDLKGKEEGEDGEDDNEENQFCPASESKCQEHKRIHFKDSRITLELLDWFEGIDRVCVNTLEFNQVKVDVSSSLNHTHSTGSCTIGGGVTTIEFSTGVNGVVYGCHKLLSMPRKRVTEKDLLSKFKHHSNFDCDRFTWIGVKIDRNCLLNV